MGKRIPIIYNIKQFNSYKLVDYLRGYEEGHYEGKVYGWGSGLLGALLQLLFKLILIGMSFTWLVCKGILMLV